MQPHVLYAHRSARILFLGIALVAGCGRSGSTSTVAGQVMLDGTLIESGSVLFVPINETTGGTAGAPIATGSYAVSRGLVPGTYRVEVRVPRPSSKLIPKPFGAPGEMMVAVEETVAEEFNDRSTLVMSLEPGVNTRNFAVTTRGATRPSD